MTLRHCLPLVLPMWLAGCVTFERLPAPLACDSRLEGRWLPVANTPGEAAKLTSDDYATVDAQCLATLSMSQTANKPASKAQMRVSGFELGGEHYLALGENDLALLFTGATAPASPTAKPGTGITLVRYRIQGDLLRLNMIDTDTVRQMVEHRKFPASTPDQLNYVIPGDEAQLRAVLLNNPGLFEQGDAPPMGLRRAPAEGAP